ncbi:MAG: transposase, partial [Elusimicrobia bacterium]|nr:transposase [Elusimicrobiota bacterium]MDY5729010.1 transposase [Elusimicrobiaceae bacterium]
NLKYRYGNKNFWCRGYYVDTVGKNSKKIAEYIQNQLKMDQMENPLPCYDGLDGRIGKRERQE